MFTVSRFPRYEWYQASVLELAVLCLNNRSGGFKGQNNGRFYGLRAGSFRYLAHLTWTRFKSVDHVGTNRSSFPRVFRNDSPTCQPMKTPSL